MWSGRITAAVTITAIALLTLGCGQGGGDGLPIGTPAVINTSIANGAERVSVFAGQNILLTFNTVIDADTAQINDGNGNLTSAIEAVATIGGQRFDKLSGTPFLVTVNNVAIGATTTLSIDIEFNGGNSLLPYDAVIQVTVLPEIRTFDALNPNQSTNQNLTGTPMGAPFVFTFTTEHDTLTISEVMAFDALGALTTPDFVEIHNGTSENLSLNNYWIAHGGADAQPNKVADNDDVYFNVTTQPDVAAAANADATSVFDCGGGRNGDFLGRFPAGSSIATGATVTIACDRDDFFAATGFEPDFELTSKSGAVLDILALPGVIEDGTFAAQGNDRGPSIDANPDIDDVAGHVVLFFLENTSVSAVQAGAAGAASTQDTVIVNANLQDVDLVVYGSGAQSGGANDGALIDKSGLQRFEAGSAATSVTFLGENGRGQQTVPASVNGQAHPDGGSITRKADSLFEFPNLVNGQPGFSNPNGGGFSEFFAGGNGLSQDNVQGNNKFAPGANTKQRTDPTNGQNLEDPVGIDNERHDETSERLDLTFTDTLAPSPGQ